MSSESAGAAAATTASPTASVSTHILDTSVGRPAAGVGVELSVRTGRDAQWNVHSASVTDADGRCKDLPALPEGTAHARLTFEVEPYLTAGGGMDADRKSTHRTDRNGTDTNGTDAHGANDRHEAGPQGGFFPEVTVVFAVAAGGHYHVPLLLNPFGYSVYRGS
ncbi:hydroxyisourate hydrolase [Streptomyces sp. HNM0575]|uniref:hydroxyisourate hydrolase n=1 Tax=Streptomyces sp. HNM0575 TaxID=2716338 RepID=UPI00145F9BAE|nr:hydroxyisourate hydrolase [Streptomyces sp. HNM0575]NLU72734.1 hydroxyisourate hydrolase [Streptomyces sp. HNM0575]